MTASASAAITDSLRSLHALKAGALAMFDPMLASVAAERDDPASDPHVRELLGRMHRVFSGHRAETATHVDKLAARLGALEAKPAEARAKGLALGAGAWVRLSGVGGQNHGGNARNAFVFEHLEIASLKLLAQLGARAGDDETEALARACLAEDEEMAATIDRNWANVATLTLAA